MAMRGSALALLVVLAGCTQPPEEARRGIGPLAPPPPRPAPRLAPADAAARLPAQAAGFQRGQTLAVRPPGRGQEVAYATPNTRQRAAALVRLTPRGAELPDGIASAEASTAFERALAEAVHSPDRARKLRETGRFNLPAGANPMLSCASLAGTFGRQPVEGLVCAGALGGNLVRLKVTMPAQQPPLADAQGFASAMVQALQ
jgi:hypothetical protein